MYIFYITKIISWDVNAKFKISMCWISLKYGCQDLSFYNCLPIKEEYWKKSGVLSFGSKNFPSLIIIYSFIKLFSMGKSQNKYKVS